MKKELHLYHALIVLTLLLAAMILSTAVWKISPHLPLIFGCLAAAVLARTRGYRWEEMLGYMVSGVTQSVETMLILILIGVLMAVWLSCGTVPAMMYYGLRMMRARFFFVTAFLLCAATSMALGSWGTAGTLGLAILGIGNALGLPAPATVGAIISGAYVGDKASPLTDCLNITAAVSGCSCREIVKRMLPILWKVLAVTAILFLVFGLSLDAQESAAMQSQRQWMLDALQSGFRVGPLLLLPFVIMIVCAVCSVPAIPSILAGVVSGLVLAFAVQHRTGAEALAVFYDGFVCDSGQIAIDRLLSGGGIGSMMYTVSLAMIAICFGGIMTGTNMMHALTAPLLKRTRTPLGMITLTVVTSVLVNAVLPDQYLSIALCGQMYAGQHEDKGVEKALFANAVSAGAISSALIPWNSCGAYMTSVLGVPTAEYLSYAWFNLLMPLGMIAAAFFLTLRRRRKGKTAAQFNSTST